MGAMNNLDAALDEVEGRNTYAECVQEEPYDIYVKNGISGNKTTLFVYPANTLGQVINQTAKSIGLDPNKSNSIFINEETGDSSTDLAMPIEEFNIHPNGVLSILQDGKVAVM